jgi:hypothetical protein
MSFALSIDNYVSGPPALNLTRTLAGVSEGITLFEAALKEQQHKFAEFYRLAEEVGPDELRVITATLYRVEKAHAMLLLPVIKDGEERIKHYRPLAATATQKSMVRLTERVVDAGASWLELYRDFRLRLDLLAGEKEARAGPGSAVYNNAKDALAYLTEIEDEP